MKRPQPVRSILKLAVKARLLKVHGPGPSSYPYRYYLWSEPDARSGCYVALPAGVGWALTLLPKVRWRVTRARTNLRARRLTRLLHKGNGLEVTVGEYRLIPVRDEDGKLAWTLHHIEDGMESMQIVPNRNEETWV